MTDSMTAVFSINKMGTSHSDNCNTITFDIWDLCIKNDLWVSATHIKGKDNCIADKLSRNFNLDSEWMLNIKLFENCLKILHFKPDIDMFATHLNCQIKNFISFYPDPYVIATDAFKFNWSGYKFYAFPPFSILPRVLKKIKLHQVTGILVCPHWPSQAFFCRNGRNVDRKTNKNISKNYKPCTSKQFKSPTQTEQETMSSCMLNIWKRYRDRGFSKQTSSILLSALRKNTKCSYTQYIKKWEMYAHKEGLHKISPTLEQALNFLSYLYQCGLSYSAICTARSALSSFLQITDCPNFGSNRFTKLFIKGIFELRPNLPKYQSIWNVDIVLNYLEKLSPVNNICLKNLTFKLITLIALLSGQRCQTLSLLKLSEMALSDNKCIFHVQSLLRQSRSGKHLHPIELISFPVNKNLCIITTLKEYISRSSVLRSGDQLF